MKKFSSESYETRVARVLGAWALALLISPTGCNHRPDHRSDHHSIVRPVLSIVAAPQNGPTDGYSGTIEPRYRTDLGFRVLGRIVARDVNVGDTVSAGHRLAAIDPELLQFAVRSQEATLSNVHAQLVNSESNLKRQTILLEKNITPQAEFDAAQQANEAAAAAVTQARANLDKAHEQLGYAELKADIDGVVMKIMAETGQTVVAGQTVVTIANPNLREAVVDLGEEVATALAPGDEFQVKLQIGPSTETIGRVREIAPQADASTRTRRVRIALDDPSPAFRLGATIIAVSKVALPTKIQLPNSAILESDDGKTYVWIVDQVNGQVKRVPVKISKRGLQNTEIDEGIQIGSRVVTAGVHSLTDGQSIRLNPGDMQ